MFCPHCELHFSGPSVEGGESVSCPYCGRPAQPSRQEAREPSAGSARGGSADSGSGRIWAGGGEGTVSEPSIPAVGTASPDDDTRTEAPSEWTPGSLVAGKYEVVSRLGAGGFGTVYKVRHIFRKKYYALKTPHAEFARDETFRLRFEREIEAMERFVHSDAVMIRDSGVTESGTPYYTMDFIEGESLKVVMRRQGRIPIERSLPIIRRVLRVLDVAHAVRIIHRDIKPDNILVTNVSGREAVKVLDFGVAKLLDLVGETGSVTKGMRVGTPKYMSPEQVTGEQLDGRSDLFSLGIVFYEMVTGVHPFAGAGDAAQVTAAILNRDPTPPCEIVSDLPRVISDHILTMLEKKPRRRPTSAGELIRHLGEVEESVSRVEPAELLEVCSSVPRGAAEPLVLRQETSLGERRSFLLFGEEVSFGRANNPSRSIRNDLILRCLPCRSKKLDPENWQRNLTISQRLGAIRPEEAAVVIEPSPHASSGVAIGGVRSRRPARVQADRFHVSLGDRSLELDGHRMLRGGDGGELDLSRLESARPPDAHAPGGIGYSNPSCSIDHVHLQRASNWPLHEYFLVWRQLRIGSSANVGLRLRVAGVEAVHALVIFEAGEAFLLSAGGRVWVRASMPSGEDDGDAAVVGSDEFELPAHTLLPLRPGLELILGEASLRVERVVDAHFKTV